VLERLPSRHTATWRTLDESQLQKERFYNFFNGVFFLSDRGG
jgi:hypothetical protein